MKIRCDTLFDITKTGVSNRRHHLGNSNFSVIERNQQSNFETILQIISLRSQPEDITDPTVEETIGHLWGNKQKKLKSWSFTFSIANISVYSNQFGKLGALLEDCNGVPMLTGLGEVADLQPQLHTGGTYKNIQFTVEENAQI